jgi:hypothetical protein
MKLCAKCKTKKKNSEFSFSVKAKDRLQGYCKICKTGYNNDYRATKEGYVNHTLLSAKARAKNKKLQFNLDIEYLRSIAMDTCPVFSVDLKYTASFNGPGNPDPHVAALDRVIPELGYVKGNVVFISNWANSIKSDATEVQLYAVADWLHYKRKEVLNAFKEQLAPVSEGSSIKSRYYTQPRTLPTPWAGQDHNHADDHIRAIQRQDVDHSAKESSGDGMGHGSTEMGTPQAPKSVKNYGVTKPTIVWDTDRSGHLLDKP